MREIYLLVILVCEETACYQHRLYSQKEYATIEECQSAPINLELHPIGTRLSIRCMTPEEWKEIPKYPGYSR